MRSSGYRALWIDLQPDFLRLPAHQPAVIAISHNLEDPGAAFRRDIQRSFDGLEGMPPARYPGAASSSLHRRTRGCRQRRTQER